MVSYPGDNPEEYLIKDGTEYFFFRSRKKFRAVVNQYSDKEFSSCPSEVSFVA